MRFRDKTAELTHIGAVVRDLDRSLAQWSTIFGVGPWEVRDSASRDCTLRGAPVSFRLRTGWASLGPIKLELIQPIEGNTVHQEFLDARGEGLHHLGFVVPDSRAVVAELTRRGASVVQGGITRFGCDWVYLDSGDTAGMVFEFLSVPTEQEIGPSDQPVSAPAASSHILRSTGQLTRIGALVRDLDRSTERLSSLFGIGPWRTVDASVDRANLLTPGESYRLRLGFAQLGPVELKLVQPVEGRGIQQEHLDRQGEGLDHLQYSLDDLDACLDGLAGHGIGVLAKGRSSKGGGWAFPEATGSSGVFFEINGSRPLAGVGA